jgi:hypothetical protein
MQVPRLQSDDLSNGYKNSLEGKDPHLAYLANNYSESDCLSMKIGDSQKPDPEDRNPVTKSVLCSGDLVDMTGVALDSRDSNTMEYSLQMTADALDPRDLNTMADLKCTTVDVEDSAEIDHMLGL